MFLYISLIILFILACSYISYVIFETSRPSPKLFTENNEFTKTDVYNNNLLMYFYTNWCTPCQISHPIWKQIKEDPKFKKFNIAYGEYDLDNPNNKHLIDVFKITEYPTIILLKNNKKFIYDAELNKQTLFKFLSVVYKKTPENYDDV
jgi:thiol-disulfide isomerase/thioredoxin